MIVGRLVRLLVMVMIALAAMGIRQLTEPSREVALAAGTIQGVGAESPAPQRIFGFYRTTGFNLQPADSYTVVGHEKILRTSLVRSAADRSVPWPFGDKQTIQWFQLKAGMSKWAKVNGATGANLKVTPQQAGVVYYQQHYHYYGWVFEKDRYSRVAKLTTKPNPVSAKKLDVTTDSNYLYNNQGDAQQTYVHATPTPADATGELKWSSSNPALATVDAQSGQVTANKNQHFGIVTITGTMTNTDGTAVSASVQITIGDGLNSQTVDEGRSATFKILGKFDQAPTQVIWHRIDSAGKETVVSNQRATSYTVPAATPADNHNRYFAEVKIKSDEKDTVTTIKTGQATLNVNPSTQPSVKIKNAIDNVTDLSNVSESADIAVIANDTCQLTGTVTDQNPASKLNTGDLEVNLPPEVIVSRVSVDNQPATYTAVGDNRIDKTYAVQNQSFSKTKTHTVVVTFQVPTMLKGRYKTGIKLRGYDGQTPPQSLGTFKGNAVTLNFTDGKIDIKANAVCFGELTSRNFGQNLPGITTGDSELLDITDNRRVKTAERITLRQMAPLSNGSEALNATISFDPGQKQPLQQLSTEARDVVTTKDNEVLSSIGKAQGQGLTLNVHTGAWQPGVYTTKLIWSIVAAP